MKNLFLMRHAESPNSIMNDFDRVLTPAGIEKSKEVGKILANYRLDRIFSSDSTRTKQTVEAIVSSLNNRPLSKLASVRGFEGDSERRTAVYRKVHEDSSTESTYQSPAEVELRKRSNAPVIQYHHFLYHITVENLLAFIQDSLLEHDNILIVNHNPVISQLITFLLQNDKDSEAYDVAIRGLPPASLFHFEDNKLANFWL